VPIADRAPANSGEQPRVAAVVGQFAGAVVAADEQPPMWSLIGVVDAEQIARKARLDRSLQLSNVAWFSSQVPLRSTGRVVQQ
jgi:hypothetical protein